MAKKNVTITGNASVFISKYSSIGPGDIKPGAPVSDFTFLRPMDKKQMKGWLKDGYVHVGDATITIEAKGTDELIASKVESLRAEKESVVAEAQQKATIIEGQIQKLLAITFEA